MKEENKDPPKNKEETRHQVYTKSSVARQAEMIAESEREIRCLMTAHEGQVSLLCKNIMKEAHLFASGWQGYSRNPEETDREYICRAIKDIWSCPFQSDDRQPGTDIYPGVCAASEETLALIEQLNNIKSVLKEHIVFLNKFKYSFYTIEDNQEVRKFKRKAETILADCCRDSVHKTKLYRTIKFTNKPVFHIGAFWGTSPKMKRMKVSEAIDEVNKRLPVGQEKTKDLYELERLPGNMPVAYVYLVRAKTKGTDKAKSITYRRTAPRLQAYHYALSDDEQEKRLGIQKLFTQQFTAVMPFFYLHRENEIVNFSDLNTTPVVRERSTSEHSRLCDKPIIMGETFKIFRYRATEV